MTYLLKRKNAKLISIKSFNDLKDGRDLIWQLKIRIINRYCREGFHQCSKFPENSSSVCLLEKYHCGKSSGLLKLENNSVPIIVDGMTRNGVVDF